MPPRELPAVATPAKPGDVIQALGRVWALRVGPITDPKPLQLLLAQWAFETGRGAKCMCWNLGNVKSVDGDGHDYTFFDCTEVMSSKAAASAVTAARGLAAILWDNGTTAEVHYLPKHPACRFRAFDSLDLGAADYLNEVQHGFASAWPALLSGDPDAFAAALKAARYYTAPEAQYAAGLRGLMAAFAGLSPDGRHFDLDTVRGLQGALAALGLYHGDIDGDAGRQTHAAIEQAQKQYGAPQSGEIDDPTRAAIASALLQLA
jgi:Putative peptidoglycan binding domain